MKSGKATRTRLGGLVFAYVILISLLGCGEGGQTPALGAITIELTAIYPGNALALSPGASANVQATVYDPKNAGVTWTLTPLDYGALSNVTPTSVTYTAPATFSTATKVTITATSVTNPFAISSVQLATAPITALLVLPATDVLPFIPLADQTLSPGAAIGIESLISNNGDFPLQTWSISPETGAGSLAPTFGTGSLVNTKTNFVTYTAPASASSPITATITVTSIANPNAISSVRFTTLPSGGGSSVATISVNGGPFPSHIYQNGAFMNGVTICNPGAPPPGAYPFPVCQTLDGILIDTGSYGLRILQSSIPFLSLPTLSDENVTIYGNNNVLENCDSLSDGSYLWGPVAKADLYIAGQTASSLINGSPSVALVQIISSNQGGVPDSCSNGGIRRNTPELLGANGILGIGPEPTDCTLAGINLCDGSVQATPPNIYYACPPGGCGSSDSPVLATSLQQVTNPIHLFQGLAARGAIFNLPALSGAQTEVSGTLTFGFGPVGSATIYTLDSNDNFTTVFNGQNLTKSFIDTGSSALFFPDSLPGCGASTEFFCPEQTTNLSATNIGSSQGQSVIDFTVDNADNLFATYPGYAAFESLAGPLGTGSCADGSGACSFDWGLPFFYGRQVYMKIDQCSPLAMTCDPLLGAYWAY